MLTISFYLILFAIQYCILACLAVRILRCKLEKGLDQPIIFHEVASSSHPMISCAFLCKVALFPPNKGYLLRRQWEVPSSPLNNIRCLTHWWRNNPDDSESPQPWWHYHLNQQNANTQSVSWIIFPWNTFFGQISCHFICEQWEGRGEKVWIPLCFHYFLSRDPHFPPFSPESYTGNTSPPEITPREFSEFLDLD